MYTPSFTEIADEDAIRAMVAAHGSGWLVTVDPDGTPVATLLPLIWTGDRLLAHMARANPQWRSLAPDAAALVIVGGPEAYVSPSFYASKREHGRVVPTWNYLAVHLTGTLRVHDDPEWVRVAVTELTSAHEAGRSDPWQVTDAPEAFVHGQLRGIVGLEMRVTRVEGKAKLSQNRSDADRRGVVDGLRASVAFGSDTGAAQAHDLADRMAADLPVTGGCAALEPDPRT